MRVMWTVRRRSYLLIFVWFSIFKPVYDWIVAKFFWVVFLQYVCILGWWLDFFLISHIFLFLVLILRVGSPLAEFFLFEFGLFRLQVFKNASFFLLNKKFACAKLYLLYFVRSSSSF